MRSGCWKCVAVGNVEGLGHNSSMEQVLNTFFPHFIEVPTQCSD